MLKFEHIIQINDLDNNQIKPLSRQQLWEGLLLRAKDPGKFNSGLTCKIDLVTNDGFVRHIQAGESEFTERVSLTFQEKIETATIGQDQPIHAQSSTLIEEPQAGFLFVRFVYRRDLENSEEGKLIGGALKSAYVQIDIEAIALIRMFAEDKLLTQKPS